MAGDRIAIVVVGRGRSRLSDCPSSTEGWRRQISQAKGVDDAQCWRGGRLQRGSLADAKSWSESRIRTLRYNYVMIDGSDSLNTFAHAEFPLQDARCKLGQGWGQAGPITRLRFLPRLMGRRHWSASAVDCRQNSDLSSPPGLARNGAPAMDTVQNSAIMGATVAGIHSPHLAPLYIYMYSTYVHTVGNSAPDVAPGPDVAPRRLTSLPNQWGLTRRIAWLTVTYLSDSAEFGPTVAMGEPGHRKNLGARFFHM